MFRRCLPLVCSSTTFWSFGAQQPAGRTSCVGCTASANTTASSSPRLFSKTFISFDKFLLFCGVELARHDLGLAILHADPLQKLDQSRAGVTDAVGFLDPFPYHRGRPRQCLRC